MKILFVIIPEVRETYKIIQKLTEHPKHKEHITAATTQIEKQGPHYKPTRLTETCLRNEKIQHGRTPKPKLAINHLTLWNNRRYYLESPNLLLTI
jgi:hypothetical protein